MIKKRLNHSIVLARKEPPVMPGTIVLGITGGIACGKSLVCRYFKELGAAVLSADELAREIVSPGGDTFKQIVAHFGREILTAKGTIDRAQLAKKIFLSPVEREWLNQLTHPAIRCLAETRIQELRERSDAPLIIYEAPLLFEAKAEDRVDIILVVTSSSAQQITRLMQRDGLSREEAHQRIYSQMPLEEKISRADILVENSGSTEETKKQIFTIFKELTTLKKKNPPLPEDLGDL